MESEYSLKLQMDLVKRGWFGLSIGGLLILGSSACGSSDASGRADDSAGEESSGGGVLESSGANNEEGSQGAGEEPSANPDGASGGEDKDEEEPGDGNSDDQDVPSEVRFDVAAPDAPPGRVDHNDCRGLESGVYCQDLNTSIECDGVNVEPSQTIECGSSFCEEGLGCVVCLPDTFGCKGREVLECDESVEGHAWKTVTECDPKLEEVCDPVEGKCVAVEETGNDVPTGDYHLFAEFHGGHHRALVGAYDVDTYGNRLYVTSGVGQINEVRIHAFELGILDSDRDGRIEPNQHPDSIDEPGPVEQRTIQYAGQYIIENDQITLEASEAEIYAERDRIFIVARARQKYWYDEWRTAAIYEYRLGNGQLTRVTPPLPHNGDNTLPYMGMVGYDEVNKIWYAGVQSTRTVYQYDPSYGGWGMAFRYPSLAGDHMDGLEVVTDPNTGVPYVYVSDMTSDFIGQYRYDPEEGWEKENIFRYDDPYSVKVEGMGHGAFGHFWTASGGGIFELGGGAITEYIEPVQ